MKKLLLALPFFLLSACLTSYNVIDVDPVSKHFPISPVYSHDANVSIVTNTAFDLDSRKRLLLIPDGESDFVRGMLTKMKYFDEIITFHDLQTQIIQHNLSEKIPSLHELLGINNAAKNYKPFMFLRFEYSAKTLKMILTDPVTLKDVFAAETVRITTNTGGGADQFILYPLFNSLIDYISQNSRAYQ